MMEKSFTWTFQHQIVQLLDFSNFTVELRVSPAKMGKVPQIHVKSYDSMVNLRQFAHPWLCLDIGNRSEKVHIWKILLTALFRLTQTETLFQSDNRKSNLN